jgi:hypothetical protein
MKPLPYLLTCWLLIGITAFARQQPDSSRIIGTVYDAGLRKPVRGASISTSHGLTISLPDGNFSIRLVRPVDDVLTITAQGYTPVSVQIRQTDFKAGLLTLDTLFISTESKQLKGIEVTAQKALITQETDRIVYNVQADPEHNVQNMLDMLRKVPLISVTAEDQILLKGNSSYRVLLNGRTSSLMVRNPRDVLKMMPAGMVEKIEIITRPPARYDSEGLSGVINIVTTKRIGAGYIGNVNANLGRLNSGLGAQISAKVSKVSISGMVNSFWERTPLTSFNSTLNSISGDKYRLEQDGKSRYNGNVRIANISVSYELDSLNLISVSGGLNKADNKRTVTQLSDYFSDYQEPDQSFFLNKASKLDNSGKDLQVNYQMGFKRDKNQLLTASYSYMQSSSKSNTLNLISERVKYDNPDLRQDNLEGITENTYQLDYVHPLKIVDIEGGAKLINRDNYSDFSSSTRQGNTENFEHDKSASNTFDYGQQIYSVYNSYLFKVKNWGISGGMRIEHTVIDADFVSNNTSLQLDYTNFIPTVSVMRKFRNMTSIDAGYYKRIQRPAIMQLNPFTDKSDPTFYFSGNPDLQPVLNHNISIGYSNYNKGYLNAGVNYSFASNTIQRVIELGADSISRSSYQNIGKDKNISFNISLNKALTKRLNLNINGIASYVWIQGTVNNATYENNGTQGNAYFYLSYRFDNGWRASANAGFYSPTIILQGTSNAYLYSSASVTKPILHNKVTLAASVSNPFQRYRISRNDIETPESQQRFKYYNYARNFNFSVSYNFGKLEQSSLKRSKRKIKNDDIKSNEREKEKGKP